MRSARSAMTMCGVTLGHVAPAQTLAIESGEVGGTAVDGYRNDVGPPHCPRHDHEAGGLLDSTAEAGAVVVRNTIGAVIDAAPASKR